jgi:alginate O-acetyltransferase complex protein AlgI
MLFYEPLFLFLFAPAVYLLYLFLGARQRPRALILLLASVVFYGWSEPLFILIVFASVALDLFVARRVDALRQARRGAAARWLALGVASNIAILVYYKYTGFLALNLDALLRALTMPGVNIPQIALPIGVSFIVFEKITYLVDVYRGVTAPARGPLLYALYVFFFPKLLAGPIIKYHDIAGQLETCPHADVDDFVAGFSRFMISPPRSFRPAG